MASLMLINPRKRRKTKRTHARRRKSHSTASHNPVHRKRRVSHKRRTHAKRRYATNPIGLHHSKRRTHRKHYRRNPIGGKMRGILGPVKMAAVASVGAIGLDLAWGVIGSKLPASMASGPIRHVAKGIGALALAAIAGMVVKKETANTLGVGALTVVFRDAMRDGISSQFPNVQLGDVGEYYSAQGVGEYYPEGVHGLGEYDFGVSGLGEYDFGVQGLGYNNPAMSFEGMGTMGATASDKAFMI